MNKGLAWVIISIIIYCLLVLYIVGDKSTTRHDRFLIVFAGFIFTLCASLIIGVNNLFDEKF